MTTIIIIICARNFNFKLIVAVVRKCFIIIYLINFIFFLIGSFVWLILINQYEIVVNDRNFIQGTEIKDIRALYWYKFW